MPENGQVADFGDKIPYKITVTDPEDGTGSDLHRRPRRGPLGHDEHAHELSTPTGLRGHVHGTGLDRPRRRAPTCSRSLVASATPTAGNGAAGPHRPRRGDPAAQAQAGRVLRRRTGRAAGRPRHGDPGVTRPRPPPDVGRRQRTSASSRTATTSPSTRSTSRTSREVDFRVASAGAGGTIELRYDSPTGPLVAHDAERSRRRAAGRRGKDVTLDLPTNVAARARTSCSSCSAPDGSTGSLLNLNWFEFVGKGAAVTAAARGRPRRPRRSPARRR